MVKIFSLVLTFWRETGVDLMLASLKLCWELTPHTIYHKVEERTIGHVISFLDELAVHIPSHKAWDQFPWLPLAAVPWSLQEPEPYGYCHRQWSIWARFCQQSSSGSLMRKAIICAWLEPLHLKAVS